MIFKGKANERLKSELRLEESTHAYLLWRLKLLFFNG